jgi:hypothetical protein
MKVQTASDVPLHITEYMNLKLFYIQWHKKISAFRKRTASMPRLSQENLYQQKIVVKGYASIAERGRLYDFALY